MSRELEQYRDLYVSEAQEQLEAISAGLLRLEEHADDPETLQRILRAAHTLKGMSATMGLQDTARLAHSLENFLARLKRGGGGWGPEGFGLAFHAVDELARMVAGVLGGQPDTVEVAGLVAQLDQPDDRRRAWPTGAAAVSARVAAKAGAPPDSAPVVPAAGSVRVRVEHLDDLLNLVGQLMINRRQLQRQLEPKPGTDLEEVLYEHNRIVDDLKEAVKRARLVSTGQVFNRYPRMVRDLAKEQGKEVTLVMEGEDIELDGMITEGINEPLVHLLRNAVAHGIEPVDQRAAAGKPLHGTIRLNASRERERVRIEVTDDGRGLDTTSIVKRAVEGGYIPAAQAESLTSEQALGLITLSGLTLSEQLNQVSGRGIGMSVVKEKVESLHGTLTIHSQPGLGTTFVLRLPTSLGIVQGLFVKVGRETFALPLAPIERTVQVSSEDIEFVYPRPLVHLREMMLEGPVPAARLADLLEQPEEARLPGDSYYAILARRRDNQLFALLADSILGREEIVVKALPPWLAPVRILAGATILDDGRVVLILDLPALLEHA